MNGTGDSQQMEEEMGIRKQLSSRVRPVEPVNTQESVTQRSSWRDRKVAENTHHRSVLLKRSAGQM
jgi:hypothetical protein